MPLPGGPSDKLGNEYERWWTAKVMLDLLHADEGVICVEALGDEWSKVEFWVDRNGVREGHQVKRQWGFKGAWTLAQLKARGFVDGSKIHLSQPDRSVHFVSRMGVEHLDELVERARGSSNLAEFQFQTQAKTALQALTSFRRVWEPSSDADAYDMLCRIYVDVVAPHLLGEMVGALSGTWFDEDPHLVVGALGFVIIDNLSKEMRPPDIWDALAKYGIHPRPTRDVETLTLAVSGVRDRYLATGDDIAGHHVEREAVSSLVTSLRSGTRLVWIVGDAGAGKSEVARDAIRELASEWTTLAFRLDRLTPALRAADIGEQLGLPVGPVEALAAVAQGGEALLLIDQLDSLSVVSGRRADLLDAVLEVVLAARHHDNIRVVVVCRQFDLDNDHRLRKLHATYKDARTVQIGGLSRDEIAGALNVIGIDVAELGEAQLRLLSFPMHLAIYAAVVSDDGPFLAFSKPSELFHEYVTRKRRAVDNRRPERDWVAVVNCLISEMSRLEQLSVLWSLLYEWEPYADAMASEHVIVKDAARVAFFHEALFDYLFGLRFGTDADLADWVRSDEQGLFRRAQVQQVLEFRRQEHRHQYLVDLRHLLLGDGIRFHLKRLVLARLGEVEEPSPEEASILLECITSLDSASAQHGLQVTRGSQEWFQLLKPQINNLLESRDEDLRRQTLWWLVPMASTDPDEVADLLASRMTQEEWKPHLAWFVAWCRGFAHGERFTDLVLELIDSGAMDGQVGPSDLWSHLGHEDTEPPARGILRIARALLSRQLVLVSPEKHLELEDHWAPEVLKVVASIAPLDFVSMLEGVFTEACRFSTWDREPWKGDGLSWAWRRERDLWFALAEQMAHALARVADAGDELAQTIVTKFSAMDTVTPQLVVARMFRSRGPRAADEAIAWLAENPKRLELHGASPFAGKNEAEELIREMTAHCSLEQLGVLEELLLQHYSDWERSRDGRQYRGRAQWRLLSACARDRLSDTALGRLEELERKLGEARPQPDGQPRAYAVGPPISKEATARMNDEAWLGAMAKYDSERTDWSEEGIPTGGARELASVLREQATEDADRFAALGLRIPDEINPVYLGAILSGVSKAKLPADRLEPLLQQAHGLEGQPLGWAVLDCIQEHPDAAWSDDAIALVNWHAVNAPPPPPWDPTHEQRQPNDTRGDAERVHTIGINSIQGRAAECAGLLVQADGRRLPSLLPAIESVVANPHPAVRSCAAVACHGVLRHEPGVALALVKQLLAEIDIAAATHPVEQLLWVMLPAHTQDLLDELQRLVDSDDDEIAEVGARRATLAALSDDNASSLADRCIKGNEVRRKAAATILAGNVTTAAHRDFCEEQLTLLFGDESDVVRKEAGSWVRNAWKKADIAEYMDLASVFVDSPAYLDDMDGLMMACEKSNGDCAALIVRAAERFLEHAGSDAGNIQTHAAFTAHQISPLILRAYAQSEPRSDTRRRCLDVIDQMYLSSVRDIDKAIAAADR